MSDKGRIFYRSGWSIVHSFLPHLLLMVVISSVMVTIMMEYSVANTSSIVIHDWRTTVSEMIANNFQEEVAISDLSIQQEMYQIASLSPDIVSVGLYDDSGIFVCSDASRSFDHQKSPSDRMGLSDRLYSTYWVNHYHSVLHNNIEKSLFIAWDSDIYKIDFWSWCVFGGVFFLDFSSMLGVIYILSYWLSREMVIEEDGGKYLVSLIDEVENLSHHITVYAESITPNV